MAMAISATGYRVGSTMAATTARLHRGLSSTIMRRLTAAHPNHFCKGSSNTRRWFSSYPPHQVVGLPSLSPTMESGSIASWTLAEGDSFGAGDIFCSVETDKATVDFEAQDDGVLAKILAPAGPTELKIGAPIMVTIEEGGDAAAFADFTLEADASSGAAEAAAPAAAATEPVAASPPPPPSAATPPSAPAGDRVVASPLAHMLAKEMGYDIRSIAGTGPNGRIIAADVREFIVPADTAAAVTAAAVESSVAAAAKATAPVQTVMASTVPVPGAGYTDFPLTDAAKEVAARLTQAKRNVPHYYLTVDVCVDALLETRDALNQAMTMNDGKSQLTTASLGVYELLLKAAAMSMKTVPTANASWMEDVVRVYDQVDINVVAGSGDSLCQPVLKDVASQGLRSISKQLNEIVTALAEESAEPVQSGMGTFTVMNLGMYGIKSCAPIIREPQACALAIGTLENRIVPNDDDDDDESEEIYKESVYLTATLSCDHRVVDGAVGAQWLAAFKSHVENPSTLLL